MQKLTKLAELAGISSSYVDKTGKTQFTTDDVRRFFLKSMGYACENNEQIDTQTARLQRIPLLDDVVAFYDNEQIQFCLQGDGIFRLTVIDEKERIVWHRTVNGRENVEISGLETGYYRVRVEGDGVYAESLLIYAPVMAYQPDFLQQKEHLFGTAVMLYALRSEHNMGIGDFSDLAEVVRLTARAGGDAVGINPLGVMSPFTQKEEWRSRPFEVSTQDMHNVFRQSDVSPYRTLSRLFVNYVYLDLYKEPDFQQSRQVQNYMDTAKDEIRRLRDVEKVEYVKILQLKMQILELMFAHFKEQADDERKQKFAAYIAEKGEELDNLCTFEVLLEVLSPEDFWRYWPSVLADISSAETAEFKRHHLLRLEFYKYCHWLADMQIKDVQALALSLGMKIGLYTDMPIGAASNGAEVWENPKAYVLDAGVGAPADPMRPRGQSWGFTPYHPVVLRQQHYAPFIRLVRENMQYSGALRIDHAMGLRRLFWGFFTRDNPVVQGAYVYYNMKEMTAVLTLESQRHKCLVIGEDLGTVPEGFREYMAEHGLLSYKVFCRQKEKDGSFVRPEKYMYMSLAQTSTHDQATACGFWCNEDIHTFQQCGAYVNEAQYAANLEGRRLDRQNMTEAFAQLGLLDDKNKAELQNTVEKGDVVPQKLHLLLNQYGARTNSALFLVRLNDIYRQVVLDNAPGTVQEYPNWRIKMDKSVEEIGTSAAFVEMMDMIKENRPK